MPTQIPASGFCIHILRLRQEQQRGIQFARTVGNYQCYWKGDAIGNLAGQTVERGGPGDNTANGVKNHLRVAAKSYALAIAEGPHYLTYDYTKHHVLPALLLSGTGKRTGVLVHPCHDDDHHYLSSIGCINPTSGLTNADSLVNLTDSLNRVVAIIRELKSRLGNRIPQTGVIPDATALIEGEPN